jgi:hypothetical protein
MCYAADVSHAQMDRPVIPGKRRGKTVAKMKKQASTEVQAKESPPKSGWLSKKGSGKRL